MRFADREFSPGLWPSLITLIFLVILLSLGFWQLERAEQKRALVKGFHADRNATVIQLEADFNLQDNSQYQFASAVGYYDSEHQFLLDNKTHNGLAGYHVLTPFRLRETQVAVLVNRGWIPLGQTRAELPDPQAGAERQSITGRIRPPMGGFMLGQEEPRRGWPYRIQRIETDRLGKELGYPLLPIVLLLDKELPDGFVRDWKPLPPQFGPEKSVAYAVQWFGLAAALFIIYLVVNTKKVAGKK